MTIWTPDITGRDGPKYRALADAIAEAIETGDLAEGERLPTHRDLAWKLGITVGTVTRAYALGQSEGLIAGEVGRGTYVLAKQDRPATPGSKATFRTPMTAFERPAGESEKPSGPIVMNQNFTAAPWVNEMLADAIQGLADPRRLGGIDGYLPSNGLLRHRLAGRDWLRRFGLERDENSILIVSGCQHGLSVAFLGLAKPGDTVLVESLTWPGARQMAEMRGLKVATVAVDDQGIRPDAFEAACREFSPRLLYTVPTLHNPTTSILPEDRRRAIAEIAIRHGVYILEDDVFGYVADNAPPPISNFAQEMGIYVTSLSKPVAPILRTGFISAPAGLVPRLASAIRATALMTSSLNTEIAADLIQSGAAEESLNRHRASAALRQKMASTILGEASTVAHPNGTHIWLSLPPLWTGETFEAEALARGVAVTPGNIFAVEENTAANGAIRLCIGAESDPERIREGLEVIAALLSSGPSAAEPIV